MPEDDVTITISGLEELHARLLRIPPKLAEETGQWAVGQGAQVLADQCELNVPRLTGELAEDQGFEVKVGRKIDVVFANITAWYTGKVAKTSRSGGAPSTEDPGVYDQWLEFGRSNQTPQPFMRTAFDEAGERAIQTFAAAMEEALDAVIISVAE